MVTLIFILVLCLNPVLNPSLDGYVKFVLFTHEKSWNGHDFQFIEL